MAKLLGLKPEDGVSEIRKRFRDLALLHHPDLNPDDARAERRFRALVKVRDALLAHARAGTDAGDDERESTPTGGPRRGSLRVGNDLVVPVDLEFVEAARGTTVEFRLPAGGKVRVRIRPGSGQGDLVPVPVVDRDGRQLRLLFEIRVPQHRRYRRQGADLIVRARWTREQMMRGGTLVVETPFERVKVSVDPYHQHGDAIRCPGRGLPSPQGRGDLYVELADRDTVLRRTRG